MGVISFVYYLLRGAACTVVLTRGEEKEELP